MRPGRRGGRSVQQAAVAAAETSSRLRWRRELFEETAHGVALIDAASETIALVNAPFAMMHGYSPLELKGMPFWRLFAPVERAGVGALMRRLEDRGRVGFESLQQRRDGRSFPCWLDVSTVRDEAGSARYYVANIYDITDWKRKDERDRLLARAVALLGSSLDFEATLRRVIELSVPAFADWASFRVLENGKIRTIALYHRDPELQQLIYELERRYPLRPDCPVGVAKVLRTGESQLLPDVPASLIDALAVDAEHRALIERVGARSLLTVPVIARGEVVGAIALRMGGSGRKFDESDLEFAEELASRAAYAIDNARLYGRERRARKVAERLQAVTAALSTALTAEDVADAMIEQAMQVLGAQSGLVCRVSEDGTHFEIARTAGMHDAATADWQRFPVDPSLPMGDSVCRREPLYFATRAAMMRAYPALARSNESPASEAWVVAGLVVNGRPVGAMSFGFEDAREFTDDERAFVRSLTEACATAMDRARLYELERRRRMEADARKRRADLLAEASRLLSEHLDYEATLAAIAQSAVPHLADWCAVDILEDPDDRSWPPRLRQVALVHKDPNEIDRSRELMRQFPRDWSGERGLGRVLKDGVTEFHRVVDDALFRAAASSPEHLAFMRSTQVSSIIIAPLIARGRILGAITFLMAGSGRHYVVADRQLAEDLASRAAIAVDNARLFRDMERARREAEEARARAEEDRLRADKANRAKSEFLALMSHELRTPLNAIAGFTELLELELHGPISPRQRDDLARIRRNQQHLLKLISDILNFSRIEAGQLVTEVTNVDVASVLAGIEALVGPQVEARRIRYDVADCHDTIVRADRDRLQQVLLNLVSNAIRFTDPGGEIAIDCESDESNVQIRIRDSGIGIPPDKLDQIFEPFVQVDASLTRRSGGTGLGLAISRDLLEAMEGSIRVESEPGRGSTFTVVLPRGGPAS